MIGLLRFLLALAVLVAHLAQPYPAQPGLLAVFGFYTISGYLVTMLLDGTYRSSPWLFLANRALRIYPAYLVVAAAGFAVALAGGSPLNAAIAVPADWNATARQIGIFGLTTMFDGAFAVRLVPPAWSLNIELVWWLAMVPLTRLDVRIWLGASAILAAYLAATNNIFLAYSTFVGPSFAFAMGAFAFRYRPKGDLPVWTIPASLTALLALPFIEALVGFNAAWLYAASIVTAAATVAVSRRFGGWLGKADTWLGLLSYPMFLSHWVVATLFNLPPGWPLFYTAIVPLLGVSFLVVLAVEKPIEPLRDAVRARAKRKSAQAE